MKLFVADEKKVVNVHIYGVDSEEHTEDFFLRYLLKFDEIYPTTDEEKAVCNIEAEYTVSSGKILDMLAPKLRRIQSVINDIADMTLNGFSESDYIFEDSGSYLI